MKNRNSWIHFFCKVFASLCLLAFADGNPALALTSAPSTASSPMCAGGCNSASRQPFLGFLITGTGVPNSTECGYEWLPGGNVADAFEKDTANTQACWQHAGCSKDMQIINTIPSGSIQFDYTGAQSSVLHASRLTYSPYHCYDQYGYFIGAAAIIAYCDGHGPGTGLVTGTDYACYCPIGKDWSSTQQRCVVILDRWHASDPPKRCPAAMDPAIGDPIYPLRGSNRQTADLGFAIGRENANIVFDSLRKIPYAAGSGQANGSPAYAPTPPLAFPAAWGSSLHKALIVQAGSIQAYRGGGHWVSFTKTGSTYVADATVSDSLIPNGTGWTYIDKTGLAQEIYDATGRLVHTSYAGGGWLDYAYSTANTPVTQAPDAGLLISITDDKLRSVSIDYDVSSRVVQMTLPQGRALRFGYTSDGNLAQIRWSDGTVRSFVYERADLPWALTGVIDEANARHASFTYDANGLAVGTALQASPGSAVFAYGVDYGAARPEWWVTELYELETGILWRDHYLIASPRLLLSLPTGATSTMTGVSISGSPRLTGQSQPAGSGCSASTSAQGYDTNGNLASRDDFNGYRVCYANDLSRNLELTRVEGLAGGTSCGVTAAGSALPSGARKVNTQWHPDWPLPIKLAEPGRIRTSIYNGQPDPFAGGALASCAPSGATLPDGKPIAVLCRQIEVATTDADGSQGFAAQAQPGVAVREQHWTYNQFGQMLSATDPLGNTTAYAYYTNTAFTGTDPNAVGHTTGDLATVTNPAGHVTQYTLYNKAGQVLQQIDPNGVVTVNQYDARQRLISTTTGGQTTAYAYWPTGLLQSVTQPDGRFVNYRYDDAHRLVQVADNLGNSITYTLDNLGNRTVEAVKDPANVLRRSLGRDIDALGRVQQVTGLQ